MRARDRLRAGNDDDDDNGRSSSSSSDDEVSEVDDDADANPQKRKAREAAKKKQQKNALSSEASIIRALKTLSASEDSDTVWSCLAAWRFLQRTLHVSPDGLRQLVQHGIIEATLLFARSSRPKVLLLWLPDQSRKILQYTQV